MRKLTIGVRGCGVLISHQTVDAIRLITPGQARRYARLLLDAADAAERVDDPDDLLPDAAVVPGPSVRSPRWTSPTLEERDAEIDEYVAASEAAEVAASAASEEDLAESRAARGRVRDPSEND